MTGGPFAARRSALHLPAGHPARRAPCRLRTGSSLVANAPADHRRSAGDLLWVPCGYSPPSLGISHGFRPDPHCPAWGSPMDSVQILTARPGISHGFRADPHRPAGDLPWIPCGSSSSGLEDVSRILKGLFLGCPFGLSRNLARSSAAHVRNFSHHLLHASSGDPCPVLPRTSSWLSSLSAGSSPPPEFRVKFHLLLSRVSS